MKTQPEVWRMFMGKRKDAPKCLDLKDYRDESGVLDCLRVISTVQERGLKRRSINAKKILERDFYTCQCCLTLGEEVHHIQPVYLGGSSDPNNLITLCHRCHKEAPNDPEDFLEYQSTFGANGLRTMNQWIEDSDPDQREKVVRQYKEFRLKLFAANVCKLTGDKSLWESVLSEFRL